MVSGTAAGRSARGDLRETGARGEFCAVAFIADDAVDTRHRRSPAGPENQRIDGLGRATDQRFDAAVAAVAHPAGETEPLRLRAQRPTVTDALDATADAQISADGFKLLENIFQKSK